MSKPTFPLSILAGIFSSHNSHVWAEANPHAAFVHRHRDGVAVNVWAGIMHDFLSESYLFPHGSLHRFTGHFWRKFYLEHWRKSPWHSRETWFQNDRAAGDFAHQVREQLTATYSNCWNE
jgi:hypothetical protein